MLKRQKEQPEGTENNPGNKNSGANSTIPNNNTNKNNNSNYKSSNRAERKPISVYAPCETCGRRNLSTQKCCYGANAANKPPPRHRRPGKPNQVQKRANQNDLKDFTQAAAQNLN